MTKLTTIKVWDPLIRIGHWTLVIAFFTAYFTEDDLMTQHTWAGYTVAIVILIRLIWGFIGSPYAKFSNFIYKPSEILSYLKNMIAHKEQHYVGHNPAGGAMVIALLFCLSMTVLSGMKLYAVEENKGPFSVVTKIGIKQAMASSLALKGNHQKHRSNEKDEEFWEALHEIFVNLTLLLVFLHIGGIIASSIIDKEKLVKAMWTGKKEIDNRYQ
jgi:cytochrome b